jgi:hypothetical protein
MSRATVTAIYRVVSASNRDKDTLIGVFDLHQIPLVGELISIQGDPYIVRERSWEIDETFRPEMTHPFCYLRVVKAGDF